MSADFFGVRYLGTALEFGGLGAALGEATDDAEKHG